ncbi:unnamed protein product [Effrenium voratum]|uniref:Prolyl 4-hydroxylase alpha subunit Fe(2+) 2OG dioxygenase domain-containing protein n=1 Tax=Effrenium voratum TaxID=2562239 RepID=A0AA36HSG3_9DINO|nr:unnamed protein product [Effrenium voratum]
MATSRRLARWLPALAAPAAYALHQSYLPASQSSSTCQHSQLDKLITREHVQELESQGFVVIPAAVQQVLGHAALERARRDASSCHFGKSSNRGQTVRDDVVCWISASDDSPGEGLVSCGALLRGAAAALERHGYRGSRHHRVPLLLQLSRFEPGGRGYGRHLDCNFQSAFELGISSWLRAAGSRARVLTAMVYLNDPDWAGRDGGQLRIFHGPQWDGSRWRDHTDVFPAGGTLVIFKSPQVPHQVLPPRKVDRQDVGVRDPHTSLVAIKKFG